MFYSTLVGTLALLPLAAASDDLEQVCERWKKVQHYRAIASRAQPRKMDVCGVAWPCSNHTSIGKRLCLSHALRRLVPTATAMRLLPWPTLSW